MGVPVTQISGHLPENSFKTPLCQRKSPFKGFDTADVGIDKNNLGLLAMEERVKILGGTFKLWSEKNQGNGITFLVPFSSLGEVKDEAL